MAGRLAAFFESWIGGLADALVIVGDRLTSRDHSLRAVSEGDEWLLLDGTEAIGRIDAFTKPDEELNRLLRGRRIDVTLAENRLFRSELPPVPAESREFLAAVVEHRVERIAPWRREDRLTGFAEQPREDGQVGVSVAVTARMFVAPMIAIAEAAGARGLSIQAGGGDGNGVPIEIGLPSAGARSIKLRRGIAFALLAFAAGAISWGGFLAWSAYDLSQQTALAQDQIDQRMAILRKATAAAGQNVQDTTDPIDRAKQTRPVVVVVIEALSRLLPDDTFLSSLRFAEDEVRISGVTRSMSRLVPLLVASPYFSDAAFAEPTERQEDGSDRFSIRLTIKPDHRMEAL